MHKILVIGGAGYVGHQLCAELLSHGNGVTVFDTCWYGEGPPGVVLRKGDIRDRAALKDAARGHDIIIHLACISNDPSMDLDPILGREINLDAFSNVLAAVWTAQPQRFIYASSSSVYGVQEIPDVTETTPCSPLTDYSKYKLECEEILRLCDPGKTTWTIIRPATVAGYSPRMRFDLALNAMTLSALTSGRVTVHGGDQLRPMIHIDDMVRAYLTLIKANRRTIHRRTYNAGGQNFTLRRLAHTVAHALHGGRVTIHTEESRDPRSYHINSDLIFKNLGFKANKTLSSAVLDIAAAYEAGAFSDPLKNPKYYNILRMKEIER